MLIHWSNLVCSRVMAWKKNLAPELWILQPLLSIIHPTAGAKQIFIHASCSLIPEFCRVDCYFKHWRGEREKRGKETKLAVMQAIEILPIHWETLAYESEISLERIHFDSRNSNHNTEVSLVSFMQRSSASSWRCRYSNRHCAHYRKYKTQNCSNTNKMIWGALQGSRVQHLHPWAAGACLPPRAEQQRSSEHPCLAPH